MKKLLMLAVVVALLAMPMVLGAITITGKAYCDISTPCSGGQTCQSNECVPEFTAIGAGIAIAGAGAAYWFIRSRKK